MCGLTMDVGAWPLGRDFPFRLACRALRRGGDISSVEVSDSSVLSLACRGACTFGSSSIPCCSASDSGLVSSSLASFSRLIPGATSPAACSPNVGRSGLFGRANTNPFGGFASGSRLGLGEYRSRGFPLEVGDVEGSELSDLFPQRCGIVFSVLVVGILPLPRFPSKSRLFPARTFGHC